eukprot:2180158-Prorocentrum_lima.AAC.1
MASLAVGFAPLSSALNVVLLGASSRGLRKGGLRSVWCVRAQVRRWLTFRVGIPLLACGDKVHQAR